MNHQYVTDGDAAVKTQIAAVPHQSDAVRELDTKIRKAAGWNEEKQEWASREPQPLKIRVKTTGAVLTTGFEHARNLIILGTAELAE
jgi:hypothetical protein